MSDASPFGEFDLIERYLSPLAGEGAFGLTDDVAMLQKAGAITKDLLVSGVHFFHDDPLDTVAKKALRVNLSDLVAKGCQPTSYLMGIVWPKEADQTAVTTFVRGLKEDQQHYGLSLLGGDTTRHTKGGRPLTISITMIGQPFGVGPVLRRGARPGDEVFVTGAIGDGYLGLQAWRFGRVGDDIISEYRTPRPPFALADVIAQYAHASIDVSDGLVADAGHLAKASGVGIVLDAAKVPLSAAGKAMVAEKGEEGLGALITGGDDYQCLFAAPTNAAPGLYAMAKEANIRLTAIGRCEAGAPSVRVLDAVGQQLAIGRSGFQHF
ncbi:MAG: thiamine-phosphate kinase [Pseudomonadota bacterium]